MNIGFIKECLDETKYAYISSKNNLLWLEQYRLENQNYRDYEGREILELLQNADDAQSEYVDIYLDTCQHILTIKNYGKNTKVFTAEGMRSIMASYLSPKKNDTANNGKLIGAKGLGFKSILNWASEITIKSDNVVVRFGDDVVCRFWDELKSIIPNPEEYEKEAIKDGHRVPIPILRIPEISEWNDCKPSTTIIELDYFPDKAEKSILKSLENFSPESLLFLHNLREIRIAINGKEQRYTLCKSFDNKGMEICTVNDSNWLVSHDSGVIEGKNYEVSAAFNLDGNNRDSYNFYTFFPTDEEFPFPCILHATLELNASRKAIQTGVKINSTMMYLISERIIALADELKTRTHGWDAYKIVSGNFLNKNYCGYAKELKSILEYKTKDNEYIPILSDCRYAKANECYYYNDSFFNFIKDNGGSHIFEKMMLSGGPQRIVCQEDSDVEEHIETFVSSLKDKEEKSKEDLAKFIKIVYDYFYKKSLFHKKVELCLLKDEKGNLIKGNAYLNTGRIISDIPDFLNIRYADEDLKKHLLKEFDEHGSEQDQVRSIAGKLNERITNVSASDVNGIKKMLMLSRSDFSKYKHYQINQIIECLFKLYESNIEEFKNLKIECYLPTEGGGCRAAKELIFGDKRFPDGIKKLNLKSDIHEDKDYVAYPDFLSPDEIEDEDISNQKIQDFYAELGVNKYFRTAEVCYGDDIEYLHLNKVSDNTITYASSSKVGNDDNRVIIPIGLDKWNELSLSDLIRFINTSGLNSQIIANTELKHCYRKGKVYSEPLKINYLSYLLQKKTEARRLSNYIISTKEWLVDPVNSFSYDDKDDILLAVLRRLGAKKSYSDFSAAELYQLINSKADECEHTSNTKGVKEFYHKVKMAFVEIGSKSGLPENVTLRMMCTKNGKNLFLNSREIFYSNNWNSKKLQSELPILSLQLRDGEDEVNKYFGCRRVKDLKVSIIDRNDNTILTCELNERIERCKPHFLATTSKDTGDGITYDKDKKTLIDRISMNVVASASYFFEHDDIHTDPEQIKDGEMIFVGKIPMICSKSESLGEALQDPMFCNVVAEAICVFLNLSSKENTDRFYRIIKASNRELEFLANTFHPGLWQSCQEAFGISDKEIAFWEKVFDINNLCLDRDKLRSGKSKYISECLGISLDRANINNFTLYHLQQLQNERDKYVACYKILLHEKALGSRANQKQYLSRINEFQSNDWINESFTDRELYAKLLDYKKIMIRQLKDRFNFHPETIDFSNSHVPAKYEYYNYEGLELNIEDESLLYFEGNEEYFANLRSKTDCNLSVAEKSDSQENHSEDDDVENTLNITIVDVEKKTRNSTEWKGENKRGKGRTRRKLNDEDLKQLGYDAEDKAIKALKSPDSGYDIGAIYSTHLNPESGNDAQGYDLEYKRKGESIYRYLEIKHFSGDSIIVSRHEYETARKYNGLYDIALVYYDRIQIWENAFSDESKYTKTSDDYTITFKTTHLKKP